MAPEIQKRFEDPAQYEGMMAKVFPGYEQLPLVILSYLRTRVGARSRHLDVGCGTGATLATFAVHQLEWSLVGVDPSEPMLALARSKLNAMNAGGRSELIHGTVETLSSELRFDAATCILVEHLLPDDGTKLDFLKAICRRIVPGGWFILAGLHGDLATAADQNALEAWLEFVALQGQSKVQQESVRHRATVEDSLVPEVRIRELLKEAGFASVERIHQVQLLGGWLAKKA